MANYAIGDLQGCLHPLEKLLVQIQFDAAKDILWFTGDLVNRGAQSLQALRFVKNLGAQHRIVLGNHDLHLLAMSHNAHPGWEDDTLADIFNAPDKDILLAWLQQQPLIQHDDRLGYTMVHASLASNWDLKMALALAQEVQTVLQSEKAASFFQHMYGNLPTQWDENLRDWERLRCITNYFTRARFCYADGRLELENKGGVDSHADNLMPWFQVPKRINTDLKIIFGHWAALAGVTNTPNTFALDTGCVWGYCLTAMRLEDQQRFSVPCA
jgi:bis(5'-nucleosyl)-tetraphosphatase (symmetrical)